MLESVTVKTLVGCGSLLPAEGVSQADESAGCSSFKLPNHLMMTQQTG